MLESAETAHEEKHTTNFSLTCNVNCIGAILLIERCLGVLPKTILGFRRSSLPSFLDIVPHPKGSSCCVVYKHRGDSELSDYSFIVVWESKHVGEKAWWLARVDIFEERTFIIADYRNLHMLNGGFLYTAHWRTLLYSMQLRQLMSRWAVREVGSSSFSSGRIVKQTKYASTAIKIATRERGETQREETRS